MMHTVAAIAAYLRVSSKAQDTATQQSAINRVSAARGDAIGVVYQEKRSGKTLARPELDRVRAAVRAGEIKKLYVYRLDRLTRSGIRDTFELIEEFRLHGCEVVSVADGFSLEGPAAEIVLAVMAWAAKMERLAINERISAARERVESEGGKWGRPARFDDAQKARIVEMHTAGKRVREISMAVKAPKSTVGRVIAAHKKAQVAA
jgi:DNA invertase Pin-like site-specific DNA recombinase